MVLQEVHVDEALSFFCTQLHDVSVAAAVQLDAALNSIGFLNIGHGRRSIVVNLVQQDLLIVCKPSWSSGENA